MFSSSTSVTSSLKTLYDTRDDSLALVWKLFHIMNIGKVSQAAASAKAFILNDNHRRVQ